MVGADTRSAQFPQRGVDVTITFMLRHQMITNITALRGCINTGLGDVRSGSAGTIAVATTHCEEDGRR